MPHLNCRIGHRKIRAVLGNTLRLEETAGLLMHQDKLQLLLGPLVMRQLKYGVTRRYFKLSARSLSSVISSMA
jgi:hypothetical protein